MAVRTPKTINGLVKAIEQHAAISGGVIREIWRCNAGWGIIYSLTPIAMQRAKYGNIIVYGYYPTLEQCIKEEYKRIVLRQKVKGGEAEWVIK